MSSGRVLRKRTGKADRKDQAPGGHKSDDASNVYEPGNNDQRQMILVTVIKRVIFSAIVLSIVYYSAKSKLKAQEDANRVVVMASVSEKLGELPRGQQIECNETDYVKDRERFPNCSPKRCGRVTTDAIITPYQAATLRSIAERGMKLGGGSGGATILDLHSGALSFGEAFVDIYSLFQKSKESGRSQVKNIWTEDDFKVYKKVKDRIQDFIAMYFGAQRDSLYLTHPTFFSRLTSKPAKTVHDQYWHPHIDKETYKSFVYTSLVYLSTYQKDFDGGRFIFLPSMHDPALNEIGPNVTIEPKHGRLSVFTSGSENVHMVEPVSRGIRYAITISFTCDPDHAIGEPNITEKLNLSPQK